MKNDEIQIAILNTTNTLKDENIDVYIEDLQRQVDNDYFPLWNKKAKLYFQPRKQVENSSHWKLVIMHTNGEPKEPFGDHTYNPATDIANGYIYIDHILKHGGDLSMVMSHEILEMITNPRRQGVKVGGFNYINEICDPIGSSNYFIGKTKVSNFVLPSFYGEGTLAPYDFLKLVNSAMIVIQGGSITKLP